MTATPLAVPVSLATARLVLRRTSADDAEAVFTYARDPALSRFMTWRPHTALDESRAFLAWCEERWQHGIAYCWTISRQTDASLLGTIEARPDGHRVELGYVLRRDAWGVGYATEAVRAVMAWAFSQRAVHRVWAVCDVENRASARVLEKAGMSREGRLRAWGLFPAFPAPRDVWCYATVRERS